MARAWKPRLGWEDEEALPSGVTLSGIIQSLSGRAAIVRQGDPVIPWVSRVAQAVFERMKADVDGDEAWIQRADASYNAIVEEAEVTAERWRSEGREDLVRRLSLLLKVSL